MSDLEGVIDAWRNQAHSWEILAEKSRKRAEDAEARCADLQARCERLEKVLERLLREVVDALEPIDALAPANDRLADQPAIKDARAALQHTTAETGDG